MEVVRSAALFPTEHAFFFTVWAIGMVVLVVVALRSWRRERHARRHDVDRDTATRSDDDQT